LRYKAAKTYTKIGGKLTAKVCTVCLKIFFPAHQKICPAHQKNIICNAKKNRIFTSKIAISTVSHTLGILLSFCHTFSYFCILSQLLAYCADLSKSEGQLCCCHKTGLKPVLLSS